MFFSLWPHKIFQVSHGAIHGLTCNQALCMPPSADIRGHKSDVKLEKTMSSSVE